MVNRAERYRFTFALLIASLPAVGHASTLVTLQSFDYYTNGAFPYGSLFADASGNLFGTTEAGGPAGDGTVFEIAKTGGAYPSLTTLASFNGSNGQYPLAELISDPAGDLFGTTNGTSGNGTVFEIPNSNGTYGPLTTLVALSGNGGGSHTGLIMDSAGNIYGTGGNAFELPKNGNSYGPLDTIAYFYSSGPSTLISDSSGNLYGTTFEGGASGDGTVVEIPKVQGSFGAPITLATFNGANNGKLPWGAGLVADAAGDLFGTTYSGGADNYGTVFELPKVGSTYGGLITLAAFDGSSGAYTTSNLIIDAAGDLFGTSGGGNNNNGNIFEIANGSSGYNQLTTIATFNGTDGASPDGGLIADAFGNLFGTTVSGGQSGDGTVYELTGSGFVTAQTSTSVPEPGSIALLGAAFVASVLVSILLHWSRKNVGRKSAAPSAIG